MQTEFTDPRFGAITPELILRSLLTCIAGAPNTALRIDLNTEVTTSPVHCANYEDFQINLQRCLVMASDGYVALRVNSVSTVTDCGCSTASTWYDYLNSLFGEDEDGLVYVNLYSTNRG